MSNNKNHGCFYNIIMFPFHFIKYVTLFFLSVLGGTFYLVFKILSGLISIIFRSANYKTTTMTGIEYEHYVAKYLKSIGYRDVQVTKASGDYGVDITAKKGFHSYAIQCKLYSKPVGVDAVQQVCAGKTMYDCDKAMVITNSSFTESAKKLAKENGVKLVSGIKPSIFYKGKDYSNYNSIQSEPKDIILPQKAPKPYTQINEQNEVSKNTQPVHKSITEEYKRDLLEQLKLEENKVKAKIDTEIEDIANRLEDAFASLSVDINLKEYHTDYNELFFVISLGTGVKINDIKKNLLDVSIRMGINELHYELDTLNSSITLKTVSRYASEFKQLEHNQNSTAPDEMLFKAIEVVVEAQMASTTLLQRKLNLGYARAARIMDDLEERQIVGPFEGSKPRKVLISKQQWMEMNALGNKTN